MPRPKNRTELLEQMEAGFTALLAEVDRLPAGTLLTPGACGDWSVKDILAHLDEWHEMFLGWEREGAAGNKPDMPAPGFGWKDTPALNEQIWKKTRDDEYHAVVTRLRDSYRRVRDIAAGYTNDALFTKRRYRWTGSTSVGSYAVSATSSHYNWAFKLIRKFKETLL